jgi:hypothetical protein
MKHLGEHSEQTLDTEICRRVPAFAVVPCVGRCSSRGFGMFATIHNHRFWYELAGETGSPVMLIMGFGISGRAWVPQVQALQQQHRVVIFDNRGIGETETSKTPYGFADLASGGGGDPIAGLPGGFDDGLQISGHQTGSLSRARLRKGGSLSVRW